jgi:hypothetical protein
VLGAIGITSSDDDIDFNDKRAEYAAQGIPVYLIVVMSGAEIDSVPALFGFSGALVPQKPNLYSKSAANP